MYADIEMRRQKSLEWNAKHRELIRERARAWNIAHPEKVRENQQRHYNKSMDYQREAKRLSQTYRAFM